MLRVCACLCLINKVKTPVNANHAAGVTARKNGNVGKKEKYGWT